MTTNVKKMPAEAPGDKPTHVAIPVKVFEDISVFLQNLPYNVSAKIIAEVNESKPAAIILPVEDKD